MVSLMRRRGSALNHGSQPWRALLDSSMSANSDDAIPNSAHLPERRSRGSADPTATMTSDG